MRLLLPLCSRGKRYVLLDSYVHDDLGIDQQQAGGGQAGRRAGAGGQAGGLAGLVCYLVSASSASLVSSTCSTCTSAAAENPHNLGTSKDLKWKNKSMFYGCIDKYICGYIWGYLGTYLWVY